MTQEELAHRMGYKSKSTINKIEKNVHDVNQTTLEKFADVLLVSPNYFIDDIPHNTYDDSEIIEYARRLKNLPQDALDNAIQYIEYLESKKEE